MESCDTLVDRLGNLEIPMTHIVGKVILMISLWREDGVLFPAARAHVTIVAFI